MTVDRIAYVEIYSADLPDTAEYFTRRMGFQVVDRSRLRSPVDPGPAQQRRAAQEITAGAGTEQFLAEHGEGVADIALICDDVEATRRAALEAGGVELGPSIVSGLGDLRHTLLLAGADRGPTGSRPAPIGADRKSVV